MFQIIVRQTRSQIFGVDEFCVNQFCDSNEILTDMSQKFGRSLYKGVRSRITRPEIVTHSSWHFIANLPIGVLDSLKQLRA